MLKVTRVTLGEFIGLLDFLEGFISFIISTFLLSFRSSLSLILFRSLFLPPFQFLSPLFFIFILLFIYFFKRPFRTLGSICLFVISFNYEVSECIQIKSNGSWIQSRIAIFFCRLLFSPCRMFTHFRKLLLSVVHVPNTSSLLRSHSDNRRTDINAMFLLLLARHWKV